MKNSIDQPSLNLVTLINIHEWAYILYSISNNFIMTKRRSEVFQLKSIVYRMSVLDPKYEDLVKAVSYIVQSDTPILVHCMQGSDRTGTVIAAYRMAIQGWSKESAIKEMTEGGYGFNTLWVKLTKLLNSLDIDKFRQDIYDTLKNSKKINDVSLNHI